MFVPNFAPNFAPNFPRIFPGVFVLRFVGDGDQKKFTKIPAIFQCKIPSQLRRKNPQKFSGERAKSPSDGLQRYGLSVLKMEGKSEARMPLKQGSNALVTKFHFQQPAPGREIRGPNAFKTRLKCTCHEIPFQ